MCDSGSCDLKPRDSGNCAIQELKTRDAGVERGGGWVGGDENVHVWFPNPLAPIS